MAKSLRKSALLDTLVGLNYLTGAASKPLGALGATVSDLGMFGATAGANEVIENGAPASTILDSAAASIALSPLFASIPMGAGKFWKAEKANIASDLADKAYNAGEAARNVVNRVENIKNRVNPKNYENVINAETGEVERVYVNPKNNVRYVNEPNRSFTMGESGELRTPERPVNNRLKRIAPNIASQAEEKAASAAATQEAIAAPQNAEANTFTSYKEAFKELTSKGKDYRIAHNQDGTYSVVAKQGAVKPETKPTIPDKDRKVVTGTDENGNDAYYDVTDITNIKSIDKSEYDRVKNINNAKTKPTISETENVEPTTEEISITETLPEAKKATVTLKNGSTKDIEYFDEVPNGWKELKGATTAPVGYTWYTDGKSIVDKTHKTMLVRDKNKDIEIEAQKDNELEEIAPKTAAKQKETTSRYEDYGEKIAGARKDLWADYKEKLQKKMPETYEEFSAVKTSDVFPDINAEKYLKNGGSEEIVVMAKFLRDIVSTKPSGTRAMRSYYRNEWIKSVTTNRELTQKLISGEMSVEDVKNALIKRDGIVDYKIEPQFEAYKAVGYPACKNIKGYELQKSKVTNSKTGAESVKWCVSKAKSWRMQTFETKEEAANYLKEIAGAAASKNSNKKPKFDIGKWNDERGKDGYIIYYKAGSGKYIELKNKFATAKEASDYLTTHENELIEQLNKLKEEPATRGEINEPRIGKGFRNGKDITPEEFSNAFGFRGVQFGNYVEGAKRIADINNAYDSLMDMSEVLNLPEKTISLNGELGLAFGARGTGGKHSAAAHYESNNVVINLTKNKGAGSLAHEWWHALDNYFGKKIKGKWLQICIRQELLSSGKKWRKLILKLETL